MFGASPGEETAAVGFEISCFHVCARHHVCACAQQQSQGARGSFGCLVFQSNPKTTKIIWSWKGFSLL